MVKSFYIIAHWDAEIGVYYSETDVPGLNIEAKTLDDFIEIAEDLAPGMLVANIEGLTPDDELVVSLDVG